MEQQNVTASTPLSPAPTTIKLAYEPPKATFAHLNLDERLSFLGAHCDPDACTQGSYLK